MMKIVGICGSLRKDSYNKKLLSLILEALKEKGLDVEELFWEDFVNYNEDIQDAGFPKNVTEFKKKIEKADGIIFATPEYNFSIPGGFKNAIDWASRPGSDIPKVFGDKLVLLAGVSNGMRGTARAQMHLANLCQDLQLIVCPASIMIPNGGEAFDKDGDLALESDAARVEKAVQKFVELLYKLRGK